MKPIEFIKAHPVEAGLSIVAVIAVFFLLTRGGGGSSSNDGGAAAAYYAAQAEQAQTSAAVQINQDNNIAQTAQTQIAAGVSTTNNSTWANEALQLDSQDNANAITLANINRQTVDDTNASINASYADYINMENSILSVQGKHYSDTISTPNYYAGH